MSYGSDLFATNEKEQAFQVMLQNICQRLDPSSLEAIKYQCRDHIGRGKLEKITNFIELFNVLQERDIVSSDDVMFLVTCLNSVSRKDLIKQVNKYGNTWLSYSTRVSQTSGGFGDVNFKTKEGNVGLTKVISSTFNETPDKFDNKALPYVTDGFAYPHNAPAHFHHNMDPAHASLIRFISNNLSFNWQSTARYLGVSEEIIAASQFNWPNDVRRQIFETLAEFIR